MRGRIAVLVIAVGALGLAVVVAPRFANVGLRLPSNSAPSVGAQFSNTTSSLVAPSLPAPDSGGDGVARKTYTNAEYDFSFTYPSALGDVAVVKGVDRSDKLSGCQGAGERLRGSFASNPNVDFGFVTVDYRDCSNQPVSLFDVVGLEVRGDTVALATVGGADAFELSIEQTLSTASPGVVAYVVKNTIDPDSRGALAAIVKSPIRKIGALVFRTKNLPTPTALTLLEDIITK